MMAKTAVTLEKIVALCKRRGFIFQTADIYNGLNGVYDSGPLGTLMKENIRHAWKQSLRGLPYDVVFFDGAILGNEAMWAASGHVENFHDPLVECKSCNARFRTDDVDIEKSCPRCGNKAWGEAREFHMMFKTDLGASVEQSSVAYLRPETAQSIFVNFKNIMTSSRVKIPFGVAQIGKAFRNEITPKQFLFRMREFEQMELEFFCKHEDAVKFFDFWREQRLAFFSNLGIAKENLRMRDHEQDELSHYSSATSDVEYQFPFGWKELEGVAHRGNFDLTQHGKFSGKELSAYDDETKSSYIPDVVECSVGVDRLFLTFLFDAYTEETVDGEPRTVLSLHPRIAPVKAALLPLSNKIGEPFKQLARDLRAKGLEVQFDASGSIGKRYRRQDEIGTPFCFTYDYQSVEDGMVTVRLRDSMKQERIALDQVARYIENALSV